MNELSNAVAERPRATSLRLAETACAGDCEDCPNRQAGPKANGKTKIVVGVDAGGSYGAALGLLERLQFPTPDLELINVAAERPPVLAHLCDTPEVEERYAQVIENLGNAALHEAAGKAGGRGLSCEAHLVHGSAAEGLIRRAEEVQADLIAVNARLQGVNGKSAINSVSRALTVAGTTSLLVAKGEQGRRATFRAVFATDHSPFAERCLERLMELRPRGLQEIHVVSAWALDDAEAAILGMNLPALGGDADRWIEERVQERVCAVRGRLEEAGYLTYGHVAQGRPNDVIHRAMADVRADLLIVGSQGHGAMAKAPIGSVALHQVATEMYPVLVLRPREAEALR